ncbi:Dihydroorotase protein [Salinisphaera shabanensis E1L3A]|uniref:Dihydroorotase protein n=1 Tax=Salinisphaera shabanensis E1L3A TaxID=1033802 RepID=U2E774_9GAMM|nr:allantoinase AllB [Salinisphaera shabanensis]ERJ19586.1 Dihydroorotase protein [Salinisphaera shabanensis E1L3A]
MTEQQTVDLVIHGATVVTDTHQFPASVAVDDGVIVAVGADATMPSAHERFDATGLHLLPGAIDVHVHFRDPGYDYKETWETGTAAAAMGGTTTVFEMPNTHPPTATADAVADKLERAEANAYVDFGVYGLLAENNVDQLEALAAAGVIGYKCFMGNTFGNLPSPSTGAMLEAFERIAPLGLRTSLHAETASIMAWRYERLRAAGRHDPLAHVAARPSVVAVEAVARAAILSEWTGARIHVLHVSSAAELRPMAEAKARGVDITAETCPHYLRLSTEDYDRLGSVIRVNPPVREPADAAALWAGLADGTLDMIATDHAPHLPKEKHNDVIWDADCGFPGVETQMPLMLDSVNAGRLSLCDYVRISSVAPAKAWGLYPAKGRIGVGADADIALVDMNRTETIDQNQLHSVNARISPFHDVAVTGVPVHTLVGGRFVMRKRRLVAEARGHGRNVKRIQNMSKANIQNADRTLAAEIAKTPEKS